MDITSDCHTTATFSDGHRVVFRRRVQARPRSITGLTGYSLIREGGGGRRSQIIKGIWTFTQLTENKSEYIFTAKVYFTKPDLSPYPGTMWFV